MTRLLLLGATLLGACTYDASDDAIWRGTISDGTTPRTYLGFDPLPQQGFQFGGGIESEGYVDGPDGKLLVFVALHLDGDLTTFLGAKSQQFPITLMIKDTSPSGGEPAYMGMDLAEQPATTTDGDGRANQTFHHEYDQHQTGTASGTFTITACDYENTMDGRLQATVMDPSRGNIARTVDIQVHYDTK